MGCGLVLLLGIIVYLWCNPKTIEVPVEVPVEVPPREPPRAPPRAPEYREAPIRRYKPGHMQQMGLLVGDETLPLYGKEVRGRRDQYHYYTTTSGENLYPIPIQSNSRDCMDDIGCHELYGNETVSVLGKPGTFNVKMYRTDDFF